MVPTHAAFVSPHLSYTWLSDGQLSVVYSDSRSFRHSLWDYAGDHIFVHDWFFSTVYEVWRRQMDEHHVAVLLAPVWAGPRVLVPDVDGRMLRRVNVVQQGYVRVQTWVGPNLRVRTAACNQFSEADLPIELDDELVLTQKLSSTRLPISTFESHLRDKVDNSKRAATILAACHNVVTPVQPLQQIPVSLAVRSYQAYGKRTNVEAKPSMAAFMQPFIHGAFCPVRSPQNDKWSINGRLIQVQSAALLTPYHFKLLEEFLSFFGQAFKHSLMPVDPDVVLERQNRPTQRQILYQADSRALEKDNTVVNAFQKSESYQAVVPPRNISTIEAVPKLEYSRYTYAMMEVLKTASWYAFGVSPLECANRVARLASRTVAFLLQSDYSKFDGTLSPALREVEKHVITYLFHPDGVKDALKWHALQYLRRGFTGDDIAYETGFSRLSGSPETALFNSIDNAFCAYVALRHTYAPDVAYSRLGIYGGDDGLTPDCDPEVFASEVAKLGPVAKCVVTPHGNGPVCFLARQYTPDVWFGSPDSMCDFPRTMSKFHVSPNVPDTPLVKLTEKLRGLWCSDSNTPLIADLIKRAVELGLYVHAAPEKMYSNYVARTYALNEQYPNSEASSSWYLHNISNSCPEFTFTVFLKWLASCKVADDLLTPPLCQPIAHPEIKANVPVIVDGRMHEPTQLKPLRGHQRRAARFMKYRPVQTKPLQVRWVKKDGAKAPV